MKRRDVLQLTIALAALALLATLVLWILRHGDAPDVRPATPSEATSKGEAPAAGSELATASGPTVNAPSPSAVRTVARSDPRANVVMVDDSELRDAIWIEGRVELASGTPLDEEAWVVAKGRAFEHRPLHRVRLGADGKFRVAFEKSTKVGWLALDARYDYLEREETIRLASVPKDIVLRALLGGCATGRIVLPADAQDLVEEVRLARVSGGEQVGWIEDTLRVEGHVFEDLRYEVGGLRPDADTKVRLRSRSLVPLDVGHVSIHEGEITHVDLEPVVGTRVRGRVLTASGSPISDVWVGVEGESERESRSYDGGGAKTKADGGFQLAGIGSGNLKLIAQKNDFAPTVVDLGAVAVGTRKDGVDLVLTEGQSIAGHVRFADGKPASQCLVQVEETFTEERVGRWMPRSPARTDADGAFRVTGLTQNVAEVSARAWIDPADAPAENSAPESSKRKAVSTRGTPWSGAAENVPVGTSDLVITLTKGDALRGRVVDSSGKPVDRFTVYADPEWNSPNCEKEPTEIHHAFRDKDGRFELDGLKRCTWSVHARAQGLLDSPVMTVEMPGAKPIDLVMLRKSSISGVVLGPDKKPVEGARAICVEDVGGWNQDRTAVRTDKKGEFVVKSAPIGPVRIFAHAEGLADSAPLCMDLGPEATPAKVELVLRVGATVVGTVSQPSGEKQRTWVVSLESRETPVESKARTTNTDDTGAFHFTSITPGRFRVSARDTRSIESGERDATRVLTADVVLQDGETRRVEFGAKIEPIRVHGKVITQKRVVGDALSVERLDDEGVSTHETIVAEDSTYDTTVGLPGEYVFSVAGDESGGGRFRVRVPAVKDFEHDLVLPAGAIRGRVVDAEGSPLKDVSVRLFDSMPRLSLDATSRRFASTGEDGKFEFESVSAGTWSLGADYVSGISYMTWDSGSSKPGRAKKSGIVVKDGETTSGVELVLLSGSRLTGIVRNSAGAPLPGVEVFAFESDGHVLTANGVRCDNSGRYEIVDAPTGRVLLYAHTTTSAGTGSVDVRSEGETICDVTLSPAGDLGVRVEDASGAPTWAALEVVDADGRHFEETSHENSNDAVQAWIGLPAGKLTVRAHVDGTVRAEQAARVTPGQRTETVLNIGG